MITRKAKRPLSPEQAEGRLEQVLVPLCGVLPGVAFDHEALSVKPRWRFGFYDSLIVAAAWEVGCRTLFSEDLQHGQDLERLRIQDPFQDLA